MAPADEPVKAVTPQSSTLSDDPEKYAVATDDNHEDTIHEASSSHSQEQLDASGNKLEKAVTGKSKISLRSTVPSVNDVSSVPNGGLVAWLQVLGSFFLFFNTWGLINTFGVYLTFYEQDLLKQWTASDISWIGSIQAFLLMFVGPLCGPAYDAGYFRILLVIGSFLICFGLFMLSLCTQYWQVFLAQGVCVGTGAGFLFLPSVAILSTYFSTNLPSATGIAASGSSLGGIIYPVMLNNLIGKVGFGWATRILGFVALATMLVPNLVMKVRVLPASKRSFFDWSAFKELPYVLFCVGSIIGFTGLYAPFFYLEFYSITYSITSQTLAFYTLALVNAGSVFGRIFPNYVADKTGPLSIIGPAAFVSGVLCLCIIPARTQPSLLALAVLYGFSSGALVSLPPTVVVSISMHRRGMIGTRMGMAFCCASVGVLLGTPICGWILASYGFTAVWIFSGVMLLVGASIMISARFAKTGLTNIWVKA